MLPLRPDMASLATGSVNFLSQIYENPPDFVEGLAKSMLEHDIKSEIEVFGLGMLYNAANLAKKDLLKEPLHVQFVLGIKNAFPARRAVFDFLRAELVKKNRRCMRPVRRPAGDARRGEGTCS